MLPAIKPHWPSAVVAKPKLAKGVSLIASLDGATPVSKIVAELLNAQSPKKAKAYLSTLLGDKKARNEKIWKVIEAIKEIELKKALAQRSALRASGVPVPTDTLELKEFSTEVGAVGKVPGPVEMAANMEAFFEKMVADEVKFKSLGDMRDKVSSATKGAKDFPSFAEAKLKGLSRETKTLDSSLMAEIKAICQAPGPIETKIANLIQFAIAHNLNVCFAESHGDLSPKQLLTKFLPKFAEAKYQFFFMEHLMHGVHTIPKAGEPLGQEVKDFLVQDVGQHMEQSHPTKTSAFLDVVETARGTGMSVGPIDTRASYKLYTKAPERQQVMNFTAERLMSRAGAREKPWVGFIGDTHLNAASSGFGVPGIAEIFPNVLQINISDLRGGQTASMEFEGTKRFEADSRTATATVVLRVPVAASDA